MEVHTTETVFASDAAVKKSAFIARFTVLGVAKIVTIATVDTLVTEFGIEDVVDINTTFALLHPVAVITIAIIVGMEDEVAVLVTSGEVSVLRVLIQQVVSLKRGMRNVPKKLTKLFEERSCKIKIPAKVEGIPFFGPPIRHVIDLISLTR